MVGMDQGCADRRFVKLGVMAAIIAVAFGAGMAFAAQPHMTAALAALQSAKSELQAAEHNKGGHRAKALELVNSAIGEVQAGMDAAN